MDAIKHKVLKGDPSPLGFSKTEEGMNFAIFTRQGTSVSLCLRSDKAYLEIPLDPRVNKTGFVWHICIAGLPADRFSYGYRICGPKGKGLLFNSKLILLDPYAEQLNTSLEWGKGMKEPLGLAEEIPPFNWENESFPLIPFQDLIIYEMHVRGLTIDPSSNVTHKGLYEGVIEKIPYLKELGVNAIELLPVFEFNECEIKTPLKNYWGYSTMNFFSPMNRFSNVNAITEFKKMVKELHRNGIEVILDVVFNHTGEGNAKGPTISMKGIDNNIYYMTDGSGHYRDYTGCGNTLNCNHPIVAKMILDCLRYWVSEMHVDGFRFDLASVLTRDTHGHPLTDPPLIHAISNDPELGSVKLIAEAWDAAGLYQVGSFPHYCRWAEWNGKYRDTVRRFIKGTDNEVGPFATAITGSSDLYEGQGRAPYHSINFVTAHDGFSLRDLVSYQEKHNLANGENNNDGTNDNESWNCGAEGGSTNPKIIALRERQMRNFILALMVSIGTPMLLMGDEYGQTRKGNNNTWCQDNELNWFLWNEIEKNKGFFNFYKRLIDFRKSNPVFKRTEFLKPEDIQWHGKAPFEPDWGEQVRFIAYTLGNFYIAFNAEHQPVQIQLPPKKWQR